MPFVRPSRSRTLRNRVTESSREPMHGRVDDDTDASEQAADSEPTRLAEVLDARTPLLKRAFGNVVMPFDDDDSSRQTR